MSFKFLRPSSKVLVTLLVVSVVISGCSPSVKVRSDADPTVNMSQYETYDFFSQLGVEGDNYSSLLGQHFRDAISQQMSVRGYTQSGSPQLQINVSVGAKDKVRVNTYNDPYLYGGYYGRPGAGFYGHPYMYGGGTRTTVTEYTEANVYIDMVDSSEHKLVWQGVATFNVTEKMQQQLRETVLNTVNKIFEEFPVPAPAAAN